MNRQRALVTTGMGLGGFLLLDALTYAFMGFGFWAPSPPCARTFCPPEGRDLVLVLLHVFGIGLGVGCTIIWASNDSQT